MTGDAVMGDACCGEPARGEPAPPFGCSRLRVSSLPWERAAASPAEGEGRPDPPASSPRRLRPPSLPHRTVGGPRRLFSAPRCCAVRHAAAAEGHRWGHPRTRVRHSLPEDETLPTVLGSERAFLQIFFYRLFFVYKILFLFIYLLILILVS